jgi:hypothetical protein
MGQAGDDVSVDVAGELLGYPLAERCDLLGQRGQRGEQGPGDVRGGGSGVADGAAWRGGELGVRRGRASVSGVADADLPAPGAWGRAGRRGLGSRIEPEPQAGWAVGDRWCMI